MELGLAHREEAELEGQLEGDVPEDAMPAESRVAACFKADAELLAASGRGLRSAVVARLVREGLRRSGYKDKGGLSGD